jgi:hypothetical protein
MITHVASAPELLGWAVKCQTPLLSNVREARFYHNLTA